MIYKILWAALGGALGSACRMGVSLAMAGSFKGTLLVNFVGAFILGAAATNLKIGALYYFIAVGLCGGFTTFSTFSLEVFQMFKQGNYWQGMGYVTLSFVLCVLAVYLGTKIKI